MFVRLGEAVLSFLLLGVVAFSSSFAVSYFFGSNSEMVVGEAVKVQENNYLLSIDIANYNDYKKTSIEFPMNIEENNISSSVPLNIKKVNNNSGTNDVVIMEISNIPPDSNFQLFVNVGDEIDNKNITVIDNSDFKVKYKQDIGNPVYDSIKGLLVSAALYSVVYMFFLFYSKRNFKNKINAFEEAQAVRLGVLKDQLKAVQEISEQTKRDAERNMEELEELKAEGITMKQNYRKSRILLQSKLHDYMKELNFWRDTVRKILYKLPNDKRTSEEVIKTVTETLGTYQVNEKTEHDYEYLKIMGRLLQENEENNN